MTFLSHTILVSQRKAWKTLTENASNPCNSAWKIFPHILFPSGWWFLGFSGTTILVWSTCSPHVADCSHGVCTTLLHLVKKAFFLMPTPQFSSEGANLGLAGSLHARLLIWLINTLKSFCFQQQKKENHLWNFYTSKNPIWDQADTGLVRDHLTVTCSLLSCSVIKSIRKLTQTV